MSGVETPPTPSAAPRRGIEELRPRILATWDEVDLAKFQKFLDIRPEKP